MRDDAFWMLRCFDLARRGGRACAPNPQVGCVIVKNGEIIGEGYHSQYGSPHAEIEAIRSCLTPNDLEGSDIFVSLEPCSHHGKTPPCADALIQLKPQRVIIAIKDPNPKVAGTGISKLKESGIEVLVGLCEDQARELNKGFISYHEKQRPFITLKWAQTASGFFAPLPEDPDATLHKKISSPLADRYVHALRANHEAILVGTQTAYFDNPALNVRYVEGPDPLPLIWDPGFRLPPYLQIFQKPHLRFIDHSKETISEFEVKIDFKRPIEETLRILYEKQIHSLLVEGGRQVLDTFLASHQWDEIHQIVAPGDHRQGLNAPALSMSPQKIYSFPPDQIFVYHS